jgi:hypothetical protein
MCVLPLTALSVPQAAALRDQIRMAHAEVAGPPRYAHLQYPAHLQPAQAEAGASGAGGGRASGLGPNDQVMRLFLAPLLVSLGSETVGQTLLAPKGSTAAQPGPGPGPEDGLSAEFGSASGTGAGTGAKQGSGAVGAAATAPGTAAQESSSPGVLKLLVQVPSPLQPRPKSPSRGWSRSRSPARRAESPLLPVSDGLNAVQYPRVARHYMTQYLP